MDSILPFLLASSLELVCPQVKTLSGSENLGNPDIVHFIVDVENRLGQYSLYVSNKNGSHSLMDSQQTSNLIVTNNIVQFPANRYGIAMTISRSTMKAGQVPTGLLNENDNRLYYQCRIYQPPVREKLF
jgi:hypothetical protein